MGGGQHALVTRDDTRGSSLMLSLLKPVTQHQEKRNFAMTFRKTTGRAHLMLTAPQASLAAAAGMA